MTNINEQKKRLRKYLNPYIKGNNVDSILEALASGPVHLINNIEAVNDSLYIVSSKEKYLDAKLADRELTRPEQVGISDEIFRKLGIEVSNRKQVRDLIGQILEIIYGEEFTRATSSSRGGPYPLQENDSILIQFDDGDIVEIPFKANQFTDISLALPQEVADAISRSLSSLNKKGAAIAKDDGNGSYVMLMSGTQGPSSSVRVLGGRAQNILQFPSARPTSAGETTSWQISFSGNLTRMTYINGQSPSLGKVKKGDYISTYSVGLNPLNRGTFTIVNAKTNYIEFENPNAVEEVVTQNDNQTLFFNPSKKTIISKTIYASVYQTESRILEVFIPATTKVVRRNRQGASYLDESSLGSYLYDESKPYTVTDKDCNLVADIQPNQSILSVDDSTIFPENCQLVFGFGTSKEEGPVHCIGTPSSTTLRISPSYKFKHFHKANTMITVIGQNYPYKPTSNASDYPAYLTDMVSGRIYSEELINLVAATGIKLIISILYSNDVGLGKYGTVNSEKTNVWGV